MINIWYTTVKRNIFLTVLDFVINKPSWKNFPFLKFFQNSIFSIFDVWYSWRGNYESTVKHRSNFEFLNFLMCLKNFFWTFLVPYLGLHTVWSSADYAIGIPCIPQKTSKKWQNIPTMKFHYSSDDFILSDFYLAKSVQPRACLYLRLHSFSRIWAPQNSLIDSSSYE